MTEDKTIHSIVNRVCIEFKETLPFQVKIPNNIQCDEYEAKMITNELNKFLESGVIEKAVHSAGEFVSHIFTRPKPDGGIRIILNLSDLNEFVEYQHFKMETFQHALTLIEPNCFMASVDLKHAYYSVPVDVKYRKFLRFFWNNQFFQYTCLPNGLSSAPRIFTKLLKPLFSSLRSQGFISVYYLDDSLLMAQNYEMCLKNVQTTTKILQDAGFFINFNKSALIPSNEITYLGLLINSAEMKVYLPDKKVQKIINEGSTLMHNRTCTIRLLASFIGTVVSSFPAIQYGPLFYRKMERCKIESLRISKRNFDSNIELNNEVKDEIYWWVENVKKSGNPIVKKDYDCIMDTDASLLGWGAIFGDEKTSGRWTVSESESHINVLELLAVLFSLMSFFKDKATDHVRVRSDSITAVTYINKMGGIKSMACDTVAKNIWLFCKQKNMWISAEHLPGIDNSNADYESRKFNDDTEWTLEKKYFDCIKNQFGDFSIDLFASRLNSQLERYVSWRPDPNAVYVDAFCHSWANFKFYAFPPFSQISRCLEKICREESEGLLVVPLWRGQIWFPKIMSMLVEPPLVLPLDIVYLPYKDARHPLKKSMRLVACPISGRCMKSEVFRIKQCLSLCHLGGKAHLHNMKYILKNGIISVIDGRQIPCIIQKTL